jgi:hypothetical protein
VREDAHPTELGRASGVEDAQRARVLVVAHRDRACRPRWSCALYRAVGGTRPESVHTPRVGPDG